MYGAHDMYGAYNVYGAHGMYGAHDMYGAHEMDLGHMAWIQGTYHVRGGTWHGSGGHTIQGAAVYAMAQRGVSWWILRMPWWILCMPCVACMRDALMRGTGMQHSAPPMQHRGLPGVGLEADWHPRSALGAWVARAAGSAPATKAPSQSTAAQHPPTAAQHPSTASQHPSTASQHPLTAAQQPSTASQHPPTASQHPSTAALQPPCSPAPACGSSSGGSA